MDLIYQNTDRIDQGAMKNYEMDLAYGKDENDFSLSIDLDEHCLEEGYILYMENTEYGGIVDKIKASNVDDTVTYSGRTWHGVLESKILEPVGDNDYLLLNGDAHEVLSELIEAWGLTDLFSVSEEESSVLIVNYRIRYAKGYTGIRQMLYQFGGKLKMAYKKDRVVMSVVPYIDYSQDEEFDSSQVYFTSEKNYRSLNHLICTGLGESNEQYTIHLFCDECKGLQVYATVDTPMKDSDYILTKEQQKLFGKDEVADVLDNGSVQAVKNYELLLEMPDDWVVNADSWNNRFSDIYMIDEDGKLKQAEAEKVEVYEMQLVQPADWQENFDNCFVRVGVDSEGSYIYEQPEFKEYIYAPLTSVPCDWWYNYYAYYEQYTTTNEAGETVTQYKEVGEFRESYVLQGQIPNDWLTNYANYYIQTSDGVKNSYTNVSGVTEYYYLQQDTKPTDWDTNYGSYYKKSGDKYVQQTPNYKKEPEKPKNWKTKYTNYYQRVNDGTTVTYQQISAVSKEYYELQTSKPSDWTENFANYYYKDDKEYKNVAGDKAPTWKKKNYYTKKSEQIAPSYDSVKPVYGAYAPEWSKCPRYTQKSKQVAPKWKAGTYYTFSPIYGAPDWKANAYYIKCPPWEEGSYYSKVERMVAPKWRTNMYYRQHLDHYARMVQKGIEHLRKKVNSDKIDISLELESPYDINDIVGATENITRQSVWMPITKKIVKITDTTETIEYEVGE